MRRAQQTVPPLKQRGRRVNADGRVGDLGALEFIRGLCRGISVWFLGPWASKWLWLYE